VSRLSVLAAATFLTVAPVRAGLAQDEIFVSNQNNNSVTVFDRTADGNVAPLRTIVGASTGLSTPEGIAVDAVHGEIFVVNAGASSVTVYARNAAGNASPLRTIVGPTTGLVNPNTIVVDPIHDEIYMDGSNAGYVNVYSRTAAGDAAPLRSLAGASTTLHAPQGMALDLVHDELLVTSLFDAAFPTPDRILVFSRTASGNTAPVRTISGPSSGINQPLGLAVDPYHDEIVMTSNPSLKAYSRTANGDVPPIRTISGGMTGLSCPLGLVDDLTHDELVSVNLCINSVTAYPRTADGNVAPLRTISGGATGLSGSVWIAAAGSGTSFFAVAPCRIVDTRNPAGPYGGPALVANADRTFVVSGQCGIPVGAKAAAFNLVVTLSSNGGDIRVVPGGVVLPLVSALNWSAGRTRGNNAVIQLGGAGDVTVHPDMPGGTVHLIVDVYGYFE
jgi:hypothetical protein